MDKVINTTRKGFRIFKERVKKQGMGITLVWIYGRGIPAITGVPILRYCKITPEVYVGSQFRLKGKHLLEREGINAVVNMRKEFDDAAHDLTLEHYCHLPTIDDDAPSMQALTRGVTFMQDVITGGGKIYVHCAGGVGRAPTMAAAYYISQGMSVSDALALITNVRPFIYITPIQMERLSEWSQKWQKQA
ncbi:MAG: dual specificity protein phosphatase [Chloroflexota bacterium]